MAPMRVAAVVTGLLVGLVIAAALLWIGGELRFANCIEGARAADVAHPAGPVDDIEREIAGNTALAADLSDCSRMPF